MMMTYRGYTLVPLMDGGNSQVSVFSRANFITKTMAFADEQSAVSEARKVVDDILARRQLRRLPCVPAHPQGDFHENSKRLSTRRLIRRGGSARRVSSRSCVSTWIRTRTWTFGESNAIRYNIGKQGWPPAE